MDHSPAAPAAPSWLPVLRRASPFLCLVYVVYLFASFRFGTEGLAEHDGYFHTRYAQMLPARGLSRQFPWTQASTWKEQFCDKEFLFHVIMVPFATNVDDPLKGVRFFSVLIAAAVFIALYLVLRGQSVPAPELFAMLLLCLGGELPFRLGMIRSHVLSIILALIGMHLLYRGRWKAVAILGFVYAWAYAFPFVLVILAVALAAGKWLAGEKLDWRLPCAALAGVVLGLIAHPYFPNTILNLWVVLRDVLFATDNASGLRQGDEMYPLNGREIMQRFPLYHLVLAGLLVSGWRFARKASPELLGTLLAALIWHAAAMMFARFFEYSVPLLALAAGLAVRDLLADVDVAKFISEQRLKFAGIVTALALVLTAAHIQSMYEWILNEKLATPPRFREACKWLSEHTEPGETVVDLWWTDFPELYYFGYREHYVWGLDPTYTYRFSPQLALALEKMKTGEMAVHGETLAKTFNARFMVMQNWSKAHTTQPPGKRTWVPVYADENAAVYALTGPDGPP